MQKSITIFFSCYSGKPNKSQSFEFKFHIRRKSKLSFIDLFTSDNCISMDSTGGGGGFVRSL